MTFSKENPPGRIFLVGFMGSGKTFLGEKLAARLGWGFLDLDAEVFRLAGRPISAIFGGPDGEQRFRELERGSLRGSFLLKKTVVATGGGAPCFFENMAEMLQNGLVIYLDAPKNLLFERLLLEKSHRPLIAEMSPASLQDFIRTKTTERAPFYGRANIVLKIRKNDPEILGKLLKKMAQFGI